MNTLRDVTEAEGTGILDFWAVKTDSVLGAMGVDESQRSGKFAVLRKTIRNTHTP